MQGALQLTNQNEWYSFNTSSGSSCIQYDQDFIYVSDSSDPNAYQKFNYPDQQHVDQWLPIPNTPFTVCEDDSGSIYATAASQ